MKEGNCTNMGGHMPLLLPVCYHETLDRCDCPHKARLEPVLVAKA